MISGFDFGLYEIWLKSHSFIQKKNTLYYTTIRLVF